MKKLLAILSVVLFANQVGAHELKGRLEVDRVYQSGNYIALLINGTHDDQKITCALYDADQKLLGTQNWYASPIATTVMVNADFYNLEDVKYHACASQ